MGGEDAGQGLTEYTLIFVFVILLGVGILMLFGPAVSSFYNSASNTIYNP